MIGILAAELGRQTGKPPRKSFSDRISFPRHLAGQKPSPKGAAQSDLWFLAAVNTAQLNVTRHSNYSVWTAVTG
jgi:hypothetical protein